MVQKKDMEMVEDGVIEAGTGAAEDFEVVEVGEEEVEVVGSDIEMLIDTPTIMAMSFKAWRKCPVLDGYYLLFNQVRCPSSWKCPSSNPKQLLITVETPSHRKVFWPLFLWNAVSCPKKPLPICLGIRSENTGETP